MVTTYKANVAVINSIKMNRRMKQYFLKKYNRIYANQGEEEATAIFKELRQALMSYLADPDRRNWKQYASQVRMRNNGMLAKLFEYANTNPEQCLAFAKLYATGLYSKPDRSVYKSYEESLDSIKPVREVPTVMQDWLNLVLGTASPNAKAEEDLMLRYKRIKRNPRHLMHELVRGHSRRAVFAYINKWRRIFRVDAVSSQQLPHWKHQCPSVNGPGEILKEMRLPLASDYRDARVKDGIVTSLSWNKDFREFTDIWENENFPALAALRFLGNLLLSNEYREIMDALAFEGGLTDEFPFGWEMIGGTIDLVPKPGGNNVYRAICALNRILQTFLIPIWMTLTHIVEKMPQDCSFNQAKLDEQISNSVNSMLRYCGCVDLSKATDNLPFAWTKYVIDSIIEAYPEQWDKITLASYEIAIAASQDLVFTDRSDEFTFQWTNGQPLGAKPSFMFLALTHNVILEAISAQCGMLNSPYGVLGDDTVMFSQQIREEYIKLMQKYSVPLSLHKSYEDRMVEFAGKLYVRNSSPFYNTDMRSIYYANLFDYQRATGVSIPWENLPRSLQKEIEHKCEVDSAQVRGAIARFKACLQEYETYSKLYPLESLPDDVRTSHAYALKSANKWYDTIKTFYGQDRGTQIYSVDRLVQLSDVYVEFMCILYEEHYDKMKDGSPSRMPVTGISSIGSGRNLTIGAISAVEVLPLKRVTQQWFKDKYRPETTDTLFRVLAQAITNTLNKYSDGIVALVAEGIHNAQSSSDVESELVSQDTILYEEIPSSDCVPTRKRRTRKRASSEGAYPTIAKWLGKLIQSD